MGKRNKPKTGSSSKPTTPAKAASSVTATLILKEKLKLKQDAIKKRELAPRSQTPGTSTTKTGNEKTGQVDEKMDEDEGLSTAKEVLDVTKEDLAAQPPKVISTAASLSVTTAEKIKREQSETPPASPATDGTLNLGDGSGQSGGWMDDEGESEQDLLWLEEDARLQIALQRQPQPFAYPGRMKLQSIDPRSDDCFSGLAPTAYLPHELQLWWQVYYECFTTTDNGANWVMLTMLPEKNGSDGGLGDVNTCMSFYCHPAYAIVGPGNGRFFLAKAKSGAKKRALETSSNLDRGVYIFLGPSRQLAALVFDLPKISNNERMSSLLVSVLGGPPITPEAESAHIIKRNLHRIKANEKLLLKGAADLPDRPVVAKTGARIVELAFHIEAVTTWFQTLANPSLLKIAGWKPKGKDSNEIHLVSVDFLPLCGYCGTTSTDTAHQKCPYKAIKIHLTELRTQFLTAKKEEARFGGTYLE